jgi:SSS family solute:Na+ symporter
MVWNRFHLLLAAIYLMGLLLVGILSGRKKQDSNQYLNASGALPLWVCITACIAANCGSLDVIAMMALGAQYGMLACHFYWIGAIPALLVVAFWLLPAYAKGSYPTVLDFVASHYGEQTRLLVSVCMAAMMLLLSGVCLCAVAQVLVTFLGWSFFEGVLVTAPVVLLYTWAGGFRATVYTELVHFAIVLIAIVPLCFLVVHDFGGMSALLARIPPARLHVWQSLPAVAPGAVMDRLGVIVGLGLVLSFGFWGTDFVQMQRALAVRRKQDVAYVSLGMAAAKLGFAFLIVLPGVAAPLVLRAGLGTNWNATLPTLILHYYSPAWVVIGVMGLAASLVSTFANNVAGFSSAWVQGVYQPWIRPEASEAHYVRVSRLTNAAAIALSIGAAYVALSYQSLMEYMQMIFSTFNAPLFALVGLAFVAPRRVRGSGVRGFCLGLGSAALHQVLVHAGLLHYGSQMSANFYAAMVGFSVAAVGTLALPATGPTARCSLAPALCDPAHSAQNAEWAGQPESCDGAGVARFPVPAVLLAVGIATVCIWLNVFFW